jgi:hypothetical protein
VGTVFATEMLKLAIAPIADYANRELPILSFALYE